MPLGQSETTGRRGPRGAIIAPVVSRHSAAIEGWLLADVGGTHTRLAFLAAGGTLGSIGVTDNDRYPDLRALIASALATFPKDRSRFGAALAVAAPVVGDAVAMTNRDWDFSIEGLGRALGLARLHVINDFTAIAWSIPALASEDTLAVGGGAARAGAPIGVLGPGTGLGVSGLIPCQRGYAALAGEGGHVTLAPACEAEEAVLAMVRRRFGHASAERLVSGPGLVTLYECLQTLAGQEPRTVHPEDVTALAIGSEPIAQRALASSAASPAIWRSRSARSAGSTSPVGSCRVLPMRSRPRRSENGSSPRGAIGAICSPSPRALSSTPVRPCRASAPSSSAHFTLSLRR